MAMGFGFLFSRAFWREYHLSVLRSMHDKRSRKIFLRLTLTLLLFMVWIGYEIFLLHMLHDPGTTIAVIAVLAIVFVVIGTVQWSQRREERRVLAADIASAPTEVATRLQHLSHGLAALHERALSEIYLKEHELPENAEVITRRIQIGALKQRGSWDELPLNVRDWLARPNGAWSKEEAVRVTLFAETLHSLLWVQGLIPRLRPLDSVMEKINFGKLARTLQRSALGILPTWELRLERNAANLYFTRCLAERIHRGDQTSEDESQQEAVEGWVKEIQEGAAPEFFAGTTKVSELEKFGLEQVFHTTAQRTAVIASVMQLLDGEDDWENLESLMFAAVNPHAVEKEPETAQESEPDERRIG